MDQYSTKANILVVDDTHENLRLLADLFKGQGYGVRLAPGGQMAIESIQANLPDLILLDIMMPGMNGYEVCSVLKANERTRDIPIIFISALNEVFDKVKAFSIGGVDYITKPFQVEEVLARVQTHLSLRNLQQQLQTHNEQLQNQIVERIRAEEALELERILLTQRVHERTEALSLANAELSRAARLKDEFIANVSHELRTPLNAIQGMAEALWGQVYGPLNEKQLEHLSIIIQSGQRLHTLINNIIDLAKIEAGKISFQIEPCSVKNVCELSMRTMQRTMQQKHITCKLEVDDSVMFVLADERRLKQILVHLLDNAIKFTPQGGNIGLTVHGNAEQRAVLFTVWDEGIGMSATSMTQLFKPFVQLDGGLSRQYGGVGLGLMLVYRLLHNQAGSISVESEEGIGSRFTVALPWYEHITDYCVLSFKPEHNDTAYDFYAPFAPDRSTILLVEDNEYTLKYISKDFIKEGYHVILARSGTEAVDRGRESTPEVILVDEQIRDMDSLEVVRLLQTECNVARVPIVILTSLILPGRHERYLSVGVSDYVRKPINVRHLIDTFGKSVTMGQV